ncbi:PEGA domain-containing protein [Patescibacteria group bacterium]
MNKRFIITILITIFLVAGTFFAIRFAKGYRLDFKDKKVTETGLLVVNSFPTGASVYIDDKLTTATNDTLNLPPKSYKIKVVKDGFISWEKVLKVEKELVTQTNTRLFPSVPNLSSLTTTGAVNLTPSPDGEKLAYAVASASATPKNGLYILDLTNRPLSFSRPSKQIAKNISGFDSAEVKLVWAPNSQQLLAWTKNSVYLLDTDKLNDLSTQPDVTARLPIILDEWEEELSLTMKEQLAKLPEFMQQVATESAAHVYFSPDEERLLYTATASATLPEGLISTPPATSTQPQERMLEPKKIYVYDIKEDKNFYLADTKVEKLEKTGLEKRLNAVQNLYSPLNVSKIQWFPTSQHLMQILEDKIVILEFDGTNKATIYAGPFNNSFTYPWPDGSKLIILTSLNSDSPAPPNLYTINLK